MKNFFIFLGVFIFIGASVFAQSTMLRKLMGYKDTYWGEPFYEANSSKKFTRINDTYVKETDRMLGETTDIYYCFYKSGLKGIGYTVTYSAKTEKRLISKYSQPMKTYKASILAKKNPETPEEKQLAEALIKNPYAFLDDAILYENYNDNANTILAVLLSGMLNDKVNSNDVDKATVYIIDFNELTTCYIYSNVVEGYISVNYVEKYEEQF